jgi:DeoR/GlpR family transcriptional regulator of sugar metabolism
MLPIIPRQETRSHVNQRKEILMRAKHFIAVAAAALIGYAVNVVFLSGPTAEASVDTLKTASGLDVFNMQANAKLPKEEKMHDMSFVFSNTD